MDELDQSAEVQGGGVADDVEEEMTLVLRKPVTMGQTAKSEGTTYDKLELREPFAHELEKATKASTDIGVVINLISLVAKVPRAVAERLSQRDLTEASNFFGRFNSGPQGTGVTSLQS